MGIEPTTSAWKAEVLPLNYTRIHKCQKGCSAEASNFTPCSTSELLTTKKMAVPTGIEPAISCVTGRHVNRYTTGPYICITELFKKMAEEEGFEPPRGLTRLSVFKTDPFSRTWVFLRIVKWLPRESNPRPFGYEPNALAS